MKRVASAAVSVVVLAMVSASHAKPPTPAPAKTPSAPASGKTMTTYYKPTKGGTNTTPYTNDKASATVRCVTSSQPNKTYSLVVRGEKAYCRLLSYTVYTAPVLCQATGAQLVTDDKLPSAVQAAAAKADKCLKASVPPDVASSYVDPVCGTNFTGAGFTRVVKPGADTCEKTFAYLYLQEPGSLEGYDVWTSPSLVQTPGGPTEPPLTPTQTDAKSVSCPAGSTLQQDGNGVFCVRN
jgi:hypothetical protein